MKTVPPGLVGVLALSVAFVPRDSLAARAAPPEATVFIRLVGQVHIVRGLDERVWRDSVAERRDVEVATGTGFLVSPDGWVVTCLHVVTGSKFAAMLDGAKVEVSIEVGRIEVVLPPESDQDPSRTFEASIFASDPELDLAVLYVGAQNLPYLPLGDSDAIAAGDSVSVVGFPFGSLLEVGKSGASTAMPGVTVGSGAVSALRRSDAGDVRYVETNTPLNPGNSGGPMVDPQGYVLGVVQMKLRQGAGIGWALPINLVKRFFQSHGLEQNLSAPPLTLAPAVDLESKALRLRVPYGLEDRATERARVDMGHASNTFALRIDRVFSSWSLEKLEGALLNDEVFERFHSTATTHRISKTEGTRRSVSGLASGTDTTTGLDSGLVYSLVDLGREKIVARYVGLADHLAMNRSVLLSSLTGMEVGAIMNGAVLQGGQIEWAPADSQTNTWNLPIPVGWIVERGTPLPCGLSGPTANMSMSPPGNFTIALRAAWRADRRLEPAQAARSCSATPGLGGDASYLSTGEWLGITYRIEGAFLVTLQGGLLQLEWVAPSDQVENTRRLFDAWQKAIVRK